MLRAILITITAILMPLADGHSKIVESPGDQSIWDRIMMGQSYLNMNKGMRFMDNGRYSDAVREFGKAVVQNPRDPWPHILLGSGLYWLGEVDQAMTEYAYALKIEPKNPHAHQLMGIAYAWKGDMQNAMTYFLNAARYGPTMADVQMNIGSLYESAGNFDRALSYYRKAVELAPMHPLYRFQLGSIYSRLAREEEAIEAYKKALSLFPEYEDAMVELAAIYERKEQLKDAISMLKKAIKVKPRDTVARFRLALLLDKTGKQHDALDIIAAAFSLSPKAQGEGIALALAYSGKSLSSQSDSKDNKDEPEKNPADSLKKNLERLPLKQEVHVTVEVIYMPKPKLEKAQAGESPSAYTKALKQVSNRPRPVGIKREFVLQPSDSQTRSSEITSLTEEIQKTLRDVPPDSQMHMSLNIETKDMPSDSGKSQSDDGSNRASREGKVIFNPRAVGNDLGLWVMGTAWLETVSEPLGEINKDLSEEPSSATSGKIACSGLGEMIMGRSDEALSRFKELIVRGESETGYMGAAAAAAVSGDESGAVKYLEQALKLNPKNKVAQENLKWLRTPSSVAEEK